MSCNFPDIVILFQLWIVLTDVGKIHWLYIVHHCTGGIYPIPGNTQGEVGGGSEQPDLVEDVPAYSRGGGPDDL